MKKELCPCGKDKKITFVFQNGRSRTTFIHNKTIQRTCDAIYLTGFFLFYLFSFSFYLFIYLFFIFKHPTGVSRTMHRGA